MSRSALAILNELSVPSDVADAEEHLVHDAVRSLSGVLRAATKVRRDLALVTHQKLGAVQVMADGRTLGLVMSGSGGATREAWRSVQNSRNHAPFAHAPALILAEDDEEYRCGGVPADGLGLACGNRQLSLSAFAPAWDTDDLRIERLWLEESQDGEIVEYSEVCDVIHASTAAHVARHKETIRTLALPRPFSGADIWDDRMHLYPNLRFLPNVEQQLRSLSPGSQAKRQIVVTLTRLDDATGSWNPADSARPDFQTDTSPEGETRKALCWFADLDGESRCFDWHARFAPGVGRIHFRMDASSNPGSLVIAHIGRKLGI